jgi:hypothetical protein
MNDNPAPLSDRIADALQGTPSPDDVAALIAAVEQDLERLGHERDAATQRSLDPVTPVDAVVRAREQTDGCEFALARLTVALQQLQAKHEAAVCHVKQAARDALHAEITAERDALADELRTRYPELSKALGDLLSRVKANNARVEQLNRTGGPWIASVETVARGMPANGIHWLISAVQLPPFEYRAHEMGKTLWPVPQDYAFAIPPNVEEAVARAGAEARRTGADVAARKQAEAGSAIRRVS